MARIADKLLRYQTALAASSGGLIAALLGACLLSSEDANPLPRVSRRSPPAKTRQHQQRRATARKDPAPEAQGAAPAEPEGEARTSAAEASLIEQLSAAGSDLETSAVLAQSLRLQPSRALALLSEVRGRRDPKLAVLYGSAIADQLLSRPELIGVASYALSPLLLRAARETVLSDEQRLEATRLLTLFPPSAYQEELVRFLDDASGPLRVNMILALGDGADRSMIAPMQQRARRSVDFQEVWASYHAISRMANRAGVELDRSAETQRLLRMAVERGLPAFETAARAIAESKGRALGSLCEELAGSSQSPAIGALAAELATLEGRRSQDLLAARPLPNGS